MEIKQLSEFTKNVLILLSGTTVAQLIPILISPILTRIYSPQEFGLYSFFISVAAILSSVSSGRYEQAIMIPKKDEDATHILTLILVINTCVSVVFLALIFFTKDFILNFFDIQELGYWVYFLPLVTWFTSVYSALSLVNSRFKFYRPIANTTITKSIATAIFQLLTKLATGLNGLILGNIVAMFVGNVGLLKSIGGIGVIQNNFNKNRIVNLAIRFKKFPIYSLPGNFLNMSSRRVTPIATTKLFSLDYAGHYSLVQRLLSIPMSYMSSSVSSVYWQVSAEELRENGNSFKIFCSTVSKLALVSILSFGSLYFVVEDLFAWVFGDEWRLSGTYAKILLPSYLFAFIVSPLIVTLDLYEKQKTLLVWQLFVFSSLAFVLYFTFIKNYSFEFFLYLINIISVVQYMIMFVIIAKVSRGRKK